MQNDKRRSDVLTDDELDAVTSGAVTLEIGPE